MWSIYVERSGGPRIASWAPRCPARHSAGGRRGNTEPPGSPMVRGTPGARWLPGVASRVAAGRRWRGPGGGRERGPAPDPLGLRGPDPRALREAKIVHRHRGGGTELGLVADLPPRTTRAYDARPGASVAYLGQGRVDVPAPARARPFGDCAMGRPAVYLHTSGVTCHSRRGYTGRSGYRREADQRGGGR
jgi:hypothetical protein